MRFYRGGRRGAGEDWAAPQWVYRGGRGGRIAIRRNGFTAEGAEDAEGEFQALVHKIRVHPLNPYNPCPKNNPVAPS